MARYKQRIGRIPNGAEPAVGASVSVKRIADGSTITTLISDADGFIEWTPNGHPEPFYFHLENQPGGSKFWRSDDAKTAGVLSLPELPVAFRVLGDGVVRNYEGELAVTLVSNGPSLSVASGAANVVGHPEVWYTATQLTNTRPTSGVRIDRVIVRLNPAGSATTPGKCELVLLAGTIDAGVPALTQTATTYEFALAQVAVPAAGAVVITDERTFANEMPPTSGVARSELVTTTSVGGEALSGLSVTLTLPRAATYDIVATFDAVQRDSASVTAWVLQATYGPTFNSIAMSSPGQVAVDSGGNVYIADYGNNRLVKINSSGAFVAQITGLSEATGVCIDSSDNLYVSYAGNLRKYNSSLVLQWTQTAIAGFFHGLATDGTHVYGTDGDNNRVLKRLCSTGAAVSQFGSTGAGDGQFSTPWGICLSTSGSSFYVVDRGNNRIQRIGTGGTFGEKWGSAGTNDGQFNAPRGIARDSAGQVWVADFGNDRLQRFTATGGTYQQTIAQANPDGIGIASGDVLWVANAGDDTLARWDEGITAGGYGQIAVEIDGVVGAYLGPGQRNIAISNVSTGSKVGPGTCLVRAFAKSTQDTLTLKSCVLSARAVPRQ